jgi:hypothetical protein
MIILGSRRRIRLFAIVLSLATAVSSLPGHAAAPDQNQSCRLRGDDDHVKTVSISVVPTARNAVLNVTIDDHPQRGGMAAYTIEQLRALNIVLIARSQNRHPALISSPDNQIQCMTRIVSNAIAKLGSTPN